PDPGVDCLSQGLTFRGAVVAVVDGVGAPEGRERAGEDLDSASVGHVDQVAVAGLDLRCRHFGVVGYRAPGVRIPAEPNVVDPLEEEYFFHSGLRQRVSLEAVFGAHAEAGGAVEDTVTADALVHHRWRVVAEYGVNAAGQVVRPAGVSIDLRLVAVGDRVPECDHRAGCGRVVHVQAV